MTEPTTIGTDIHKKVSQRYGQIAQGCNSGNSETSESGGCGCGAKKGSFDQHGQLIGYRAEELAQLPEGANLGLGCGSPTSLAMIQPGWTVVDLGSGAGIDCFLASAKVGPTGRVIGVDMTDAMLEKARAFAAAKGYHNVEFRRGYIEQLPLDDASVDLVISNCVINLSPDKGQVFREIARVLKPGGRVAVSDIVLLRELPAQIKNDVEAYIGCIAGAEKEDAYLAHVRAAGLTIERAQRKGYDVVAVLGCGPEASKLLANVPKDLDSSQFVASLDLLAGKPAQKSCCGPACCR